VGLSLMRGGAGLAFFVVAGVPIWAGEAQAAGFALREYGFDATATAFAGASAQADAPGFLATNPAASSGVGEWDAQFTFNAIYPTSEALFTTATTSLGGPTGGSVNPTDFIRDAYEPGMSVRLRLDERLTAGFALSVPWGLGTKYNPGWAGRYYALESKLLTANLAPSLAYEITDDFVVSAGLQAQYAKGTLSNAIDFGTIGAVNLVPGSLPGQQDGFAEVVGSDWGFGFILGVQWRPADGVSLGAFYRSAIEHELQGKVDFELDTAGVGAVLSGVTGAFVDTRGFTDLTTPAVAQVGARFDLTQEWAVLAEAGFTQWSEIRELRVRFANPNQPDNFQIYDWKDAWLGAVGLRYQPQSDWIFRAGVAFDESPTRDGTRDPRIPDSDRTWIAFGVHHDLTASMALQLGYARLMFPDEPILLSAATPGNEVRGNLVGRTDADADMITLQLTFR
jgi:long-chain fatty acid transport protein